MYKGYFPQGIMKFDRNELVDAMETVSDELENALKEIKMWRKYYSSSEFCLWDDSEDLFLKEKLKNAPIGIEDIEEFILKELKCYRETQEKIK